MLPLHTIAIPFEFHRDTITKKFRAANHTRQTGKFSWGNRTFFANLRNPGPGFLAYAKKSALTGPAAQPSPQALRGKRSHIAVFESLAQRLLLPASSTLIFAPFKLATLKSNFRKTPREHIAQ
jgi:hypothetical protein